MIARRDKNNRTETLSINVKRPSPEDAVSIIREWLDRCDKLRPLVNVNSRIKPNLNAAAAVWDEQQHIEWNLLIIPYRMELTYYSI
jgi:hypothetical protein